MGRTLQRNREVNPPKLGTVYIMGDSTTDAKNQVGPTLQYLHESLGIEWIEPRYVDEIRDAMNVEFPGDKITLVSDRMNPNSPELEVCYDYQTGDPNRPGLQRAREYIENADPAEWVVTPHAEHLIDHRHDAEQLRELIDEHDVTLHLIDQHITINGTTGETEDILLAAAGKEERTRDTPEDKSVTVENETGSEEHPLYVARAEYSGGRPPYGFTVEDGELVQEPQYDEICRTVQKVKDGVWTKNKAASKLGCARSTIGNCIDRPTLYQLE